MLCTTPTAIDLEAISIRCRMSRLALLWESQQRIVACADAERVSRVDGQRIESRMRERNGGRGRCRRASFAKSWLIGKAWCRVGWVPETSSGKVRESTGRRRGGAIAKGRLQEVLFGVVLA